MIGTGTSSQAGVLLWKEWRDQRALILTFAVLGPIAIWAVQVAGLGGPGWHEIVGRTIFPTLTALFATVLAAEVLCADFASGATDAVARLPLAPRALLAAKLSFVALATPLYLAWTLGAEAVRRAALGLDAGVLIEQVAGARGMLMLGATALAAVIAFAVLLRRGFPAVLAGILLVLGAVALLAQADESFGARWVRVALSSFGPDAVVATVCAALLSTAVFGYSPWRRSRQLRRASFAACGLGVVAIPAFAIGALDYSERVRVQPGDPVSILSLAPSPDGRYVAMQVARDAPWGTDELFAVWLVHLKSHEIRALPEGTRLCMPVFTAGDSSWTREGELLCFTDARSWRLSDDSRIAWFDADSGAVVRSQAIESWPDVVSELAPPSWCEVEAGEVDMSGRCTYTLHWWERETTVTSGLRPRPTATPGVVLFVDATGALVRRDWAGNERVLVTGAYVPARVSTSPDGKFAVFRRSPQEIHVLDADSGEAMLEPGDWRLLGWTSRGRTLGVFTNTSSGKFSFMGDGGTRELEIPGASVLGLDFTPSGDLLARRRDQDVERLELLDEDGQVLDVLYEGPRLETR